nr:RNA-directed DNA polymerase, eukaryota [Tanacetum cinerariifolium]
MGMLLMLIPNRRSKAGKRFGFVRFIKVFNVEHLVNNLCTIWVGSYKLHANVARFQRESLNKHSNQFNDNGTKRDNVGGRMNRDGEKGMANLYAHAVKGTQGQKEVMDDIPSLVLNDSCLNQKVYSLCLLGKVKEFASLTNLKVVLAKEGYANIEIKYIGGFWDMIEFRDEETKKRFQSNLAAGTWFSQIIQAHNDFTIDERVRWVEIEGVPYKWWSRNTFSRIASRWGTLLNGDELEDGGWVPDFEDEIDEEYDLDYGSHKDEVKRGYLGNLKDLEGDSDVKEVLELKLEEESNEHTLEENSVRQSNAYLKYLPGFTTNEDVDASVEAPDILLEKTRENDDQEDGGSMEKQIHLRNEALNDAQESICSCLFTKLEEGEVVTVGDFNEVRDNSKRFGSVFNKQGVKAFNSFNSNADLVEVPLGGGSFTWCHKSATKMSKLDRCLIYDNLMCSCPSISSTSLDRYLSDHRPILIREIHYDYGPTPFKFFHYWFEIDGLNKLVEDSWKEAHVIDQNAYVKFMKKLRYLKKKIRMWSRLNKESSNSRKRNLKAELADLDLVIDKGERADVDVKRIQKVVSLLQEVEKVDSMEVAQKAKIKWAIEGDESSKYYHGALNKKRGRIAIHGVLVDAPGPDGFTFGFYRRYWNLIESHVVDAVKWFFQQGTIPKGGNSSFIMLIPKVPNANMVKDFRPISLIRSLYKIIAKILANCLVMVLGDLVNEIQSAFVADRQILNGPFILNELVQWCKKKKKQAMIFKVDFEKAYDSVRWDFVDDMLKKFGFGEKWCLFKGIKVASSLHILHLFYADDSIFMGQWNQSNIDTITRVLDFFHRASGLRININKSKLMGISVDISKVEQAAVKIGCLILKTSFTYLGSRVGGLMSRIQFWNDIIASAMPIYQMSIFKVPMKVLQNMESIRSRFFNGADINSKKPSWVRWENVMDSKDTGGLGSSLWASVIKALHGEDGKIAWRGDVAFKFLIPRLYALETMKNIDVASKLSHGSSEFSVSSVRKVIDATLLPKGTTKTRWIKVVPMKINIHAWKVKHDCLPTRVNISRRGMEIESMLCPMCNNAVESSKHLFFSCHFISEIMHNITRCWDMDYMEINSFEEWLEWVSSIRLPLKQKQIFIGKIKPKFRMVYNAMRLSFLSNTEVDSCTDFNGSVHGFVWMLFKSITNLEKEVDGQFVIACEDFDNYDKNGKAGKKPVTLIDDEIVMVLQFAMMKFWDAIGNTATKISTASKNSTKDTFVNKHPLRNIAELLDVEQGVPSVIVGIVITIQEDEGWGTSDAGHAVSRFCLQIHGQDETGTMSLSLFNDESESDGSISIEITNLIGNKYAFKAAIDYYNVKRLLPVFTALRFSNDQEIINSILACATPIKDLESQTDENTTPDEKQKANKHADEGEQGSESSTGKKKAVEIKDLESQTDENTTPNKKQKTNKRPAEGEPRSESSTGKKKVVENKSESDGSIPTEITNLIGNKYAFKVAIDDYNVKKLLPVFIVLHFSNDQEIINSVLACATPIKDNEAHSTGNHFVGKIWSRKLTKIQHLMRSRRQISVLLKVNREVGLQLERRKLLRLRLKKMLERTGNAGSGTGI